jgi:hypothetical protein
MLLGLLVLVLGLGLGRRLLRVLVVVRRLGRRRCGGQRRRQLLLLQLRVRDVAGRVLAAVLWAHHPVRRALR